MILVFLLDYYSLIPVIVLPLWKWGLIGPVKSVAEALRLLDQHGGCDAAVLDVNLGHETAGPIAVTLARVGTPFIVISGYSREQIPASFAAGNFLAKPLNRDILLDELKNCLAQASSTHAKLGSRLDRKVDTAPAN
jgi:DNA-binding NtrC family response regulator